METILSISAIVISLISFVASIYFSKKAQEHNVKSVLPIPYFDRSDFENQIHIRIYNKGTGPLIIKEIIAVYDNVRGNVIDIIPQAPEGYIFTNFSRFLKKEKRTIPPTECNDLIVCEFDTEVDYEQEFKYELRKYLKDMKIECEYTDIYGSEFPRMIVDCEWYERHFH